MQTVSDHPYLCAHLWSLLPHSLPDDAASFVGRISYQEKSGPAQYSVSDCLPSSLASRGADSTVQSGLGSRGGSTRYISSSYLIHWNKGGANGGGGKDRESSPSLSSSIMVSSAIPLLEWMKVRCHSGLDSVGLGLGSRLAANGEDTSTCSNIKDGSKDEILPSSWTPSSMSGAFLHQSLMWRAKSLFYLMIA